jgi:drug/metabolite transporter (DMT)-like permease
VKPGRFFILTATTMIAFAANSLLCRAALRDTSIDAASFTLVRIFSGATVLWLMMKLRGTKWREAGNWLSALALVTYAAAFSFAYRTLSAGTGALLLFGAVQATMILWGLYKGERLRPLQLLGLGVALGGLIVLVLPGLSAPSLSGSVLMLAAGAAWGAYSLRGRRAANPANATAGNFIRAVPMAMALSLVLISEMRLDPAGTGYAMLSGALASACGYVIWYKALPGLRAASAATVQLSVPVLAAAGGIFLLGETLTLRFVLASVAILGGIALVVLERRAGP